MGLETLVEKLRETGGKEAAEIAAAARAERERLLAEARAEGQTYRLRRQVETGEQAERRRVQDLARAELDARKLVLAAGEEILNAVRERVRAKLREGSNSDALRRILANHAVDWRNGRVYCNARDANLVSGIVGKNFAKEIDCLGGVVIESADGTSRLDLTYDSILADLWNDVIKEVAQALWPAR